MIHKTAYRQKDRLCGSDAGTGGKELKKSFVLAFVMVVGFMSSSIKPVQAETADNLDDIRDQRSEVQTELSNSEQQITSILEELEQLKAEIADTENELAEKQQQIDETEVKIDNLLDDIFTLEDEMSDLEQKIEDRFEILKERMVSVQHAGGDINYLEVLFGAQSFEDFISRANAVNKITDSDAALIEQQESDITALEDKRAEEVEKVNNLNELKEDQAEAKENVESVLAASNEKKDNLEAKQNDLQELVNELEMTDSQLASLEADVQATIIAEQEKAKEEEAAKRAEAEAKEQQEKVHQEEKSQVAAETIKKEDTAKKDEAPAKKKEEPKQESKQEASESKADNDKNNDKKDTSKTFTVSATAYTADCSGCTGITSTGFDLKKNPDAKVIAVDPSVIPLGSIVEVEGYGVAVARDTGGAIQGNKIDVFVPTKSQAQSWGRKEVKVTILER